MDKPSMATFDLRTGEERFPTAWADLLQSFGEDRRKTCEEVLGVHFLERLDPEQRDWTWLNAGKWAGMGISISSAALMASSLAGNGYSPLWLCLTVLSGAIAWQCDRRLRKPTYRELQACLKTAEQHAWFSRAETYRAELEAGKRSAFRERGKDVPVVPKEAFRGLDGLRLIVRSGAFDADYKGQQLFVEASRKVSSERAEPQNQVNPSGFPARLGEHDETSTSEIPVRSRGTKHPFVGIEREAFVEALDQYLAEADKSRMVKDQLRFIYIATWEVVQRDPYLSAKLIASEVIDSAERHFLSLDYSEPVLRKIVGTALKGTYGEFKSKLAELGLVG